MADHTDKPMIKRIVNQILKHGTEDYDFPIHRTYDDCGLDDDEYEAFATEVIRLFLKEEHGD